MIVPHHAMEMATNGYGGHLILYSLAAVQAIVVAGSYHTGFRRTNLPPIESAIYSIALIAAEFATYAGVYYFYQQRVINYSTAIVLSEIAFILPKIVALFHDEVDSDTWASIASYF